MPCYAQHRRLPNEYLRHPDRSQTEQCTHAGKSTKAATRVLKTMPQQAVPTKAMSKCSSNPICQVLTPNSQHWHVLRQNTFQLHGLPKLVWIKIAACDLPPSSRRKPGGKHRPPLLRMRLISWQQDQGHSSQHDLSPCTPELPCSMLRSAGSIVHITHGTKQIEHI